MPLSDIQCRNAKPKPDGRPAKLSDGGGLFLAVTAAGGKYWRMAYRFEGKQKLLSLGEYPTMSLASARALRDNHKKTLKLNKDPAQHKAEAAAGGVGSFEVVGRDWYAAQAGSWVPEHAQRVLSRFENDVFPIIGNLHVRDIQPPKILEVLRAVETRGALDVAKRIRQSIGAVFRYGIALGLCERDPAADLVDAMKAKPKVVHMASLEADEIGDFVAQLRAYDGERQTALAIEFIMHTAVRTNELRFGRWPEIDGDLWRIPAERMKMQRDHVVPLTAQSKRLLAELKKIAGTSEWIVPGVGGQKPISQNTMIFACYRMGYHGRMTIHGLRGTFSTIANDSGFWTPDAIERQLAHVPNNKVRSAYNRAAFLDERTRMMTWWSDYLTTKDKNDLSSLLD